MTLTRENPSPDRRSRIEPASAFVQALRFRENLPVPVRRREVSEGIAEDQDPVETFRREAGLSGIFPEKPDLHPPPLRFLPSPIDEKPRVVDDGAFPEAAANQLDAVPSVPPAKIEDLVLRGKGDQFPQEIDLPAGDIVIADRTRIGGEVDLVEELLPRIRGRAGTHGPSGCAPKLKSPSDANAAGDPPQSWERAMANYSASMFTNESISPESPHFSSVPRSDPTAAQ